MLAELGDYNPTILWVTIALLVVGSIGASVIAIMVVNRLQDGWGSLKRWLDKDRRDKD
jgi:hypothetical protein